MPDRDELVIAEFRANGGQVGGRFAGISLLLITTTGARSGKSYTHPLSYSRDGQRFVIIAANGGAAAHPGWYHNLIAHPEVTVEAGTETFPPGPTWPSAPSASGCSGSGRKPCRR